MARREISSEWGPFDFGGENHLFDVTTYYAVEMGSPLYRHLVVFERLMPPTEIVEMKLRCNEIENSAAIDGRRIVNLDAGFLDHNKVVLASAKEAGQKIYLDKGIYADLGVGLRRDGINLSSGPFQTLKTGATIKNFSLSDKYTCGR